MVIAVFTTIISLLPGGSRPAVRFAGASSEMITGATSR
jgi:hypothetical protein